MSLSDVRHQGFAQSIIQRTARAGRLPHAYLFHGPEGVGKELFATGVAQLLLCPQPAVRALPAQKDDPSAPRELLEGCGVCEDCRLSAAGNHPDLHLVYRQLVREHPDSDVRKKKALDLLLDVVRVFLIEPAALTPQRGRRKIFIVREAERMNVAAQNALLKTLEEPPGDCTIILLATQPDRLLVTTRSRCQEIRFDPLPTDFIVARLAQARVDLKSEQVAWYARFAAGSLGRALEHASDDLFHVNEQLLKVLASDGRSIHKSLIETWKQLAEQLAKKYGDREPDASDTETQRVAYQSLFRLTAQWYADALHVQAENAEGMLNSTFRRDLSAVAQSVPVTKLGSSIRRLADAERQLSGNALLQLCVETLVNDLSPTAVSSRR